VTAGGTREPIDPVRFITNRASGKMEYALAEAARDRGAEVVLITAPTALRVPAGMRVMHIENAHEMLETLRQVYADLDVLIMAAAIADFRVEQPSAQKVKRGAEGLLLKLVPNPDLSLETASFPTHRPPVRVGFAAETQDVLEAAQTKLVRKQLDLIVANDVSTNVFGSETNEVTLIWADGRTQSVERLPKPAVAEQILDAIVELLHLRS
jgi:phosphopantothenoylcysteine decarboxylase/phosphopantothenate--cysteine ligase